MPARLYPRAAGAGLAPKETRCHAAAEKARAGRRRGAVTAGGARSDHFIAWAARSTVTWSGLLADPQRVGHPPPDPSVACDRLPRRLTGGGRRAAPLTFRLWTPDPHWKRRDGHRLRRPAMAEEVVPRTVVVPLLAFDRTGFDWAMAVGTMTAPWPICATVTGFWR